MPKIKVEQPGTPQLYQPRPVDGWETVGTVMQGEHDAGALVRNAQTGIYAQANANVLRSLDQRKIKAALGEFANARKLQGGRRVNVYLDAESLAKASRIGGGNVSEGIRIALSNKPCVRRLRKIESGADITHLVDS